MISDEELAERTRAGDSRAFGELWSRHAKAGLAAARQFHTIADPDDIVAEAYLQIFRAMQRGGGPHEAFRPYLYRTVRNVAMGWIPKAATVDIDDVAETLPSGKPDIDTTALEKTVTVRAFRTLPERWQTVLWYTEVEGMDPAEAAPYLGLTPNGAAALAYRAREGLKKAWLQAHVNDRRVPAECRWTTERMADYNRGALSSRARDRFEKHLETCTRCSIIVEEIDDVSGRLAAMLFPLVLGGAGAALLAGGIATSSGGTGASGPSAKGVQEPSLARAAMATRRPLRTAALAGAAILVAAAVTTGALAASGVIGGGQDGQRSSTASSDRLHDRGDASPKTEPARPEPPAAPAPETAAPPTTTAVAPASTVSAPLLSPPPAAPAIPAIPPIPPDLTAPLPPVATAPVDGAVLANAHPVLVGTGEPGAVLEVERYDSQGHDLGAIASSQVGPDGSWAATPTAAVPDGTWLLRIVQTDAAGNRSAPVTRTVTIDTIALPPVIDALGSGPLEYLPTVTGTGEPNSHVTLRDDSGAVVGTATADGTGVWSIPLPDPGRDGATLTATQQDAVGNLSSASTPTAPIDFQRPTIVAPAGGMTVSPDGTAVTVEISGTAGQHVQILIDGTWTGNTHTLESTPISRVTPPLASGAHTLAVRYYDPATGRIGSLASITVAVG